MGFSDLLSWLDGGLLFQGLLAPSAGELLKLSSSSMPLAASNWVFSRRVMSLSSSSPNSPAHQGGLPTTITSGTWLERAKVLAGLFFLLLLLLVLPPPNSWCCPLTSSVSAACWAAAVRVPRGCDHALPLLEKAGLEAVSGAEAVSLVAGHELLHGLEYHTESEVVESGVGQPTPRDVFGQLIQHLGVLGVHGKDAAGDELSVLPDAEVPRLYPHHVVKHELQV